MCCVCVCLCVLKGVVITFPFHLNPHVNSSSPTWQSFWQTPLLPVKHLSSLPTRDKKKVKSRDMHCRGLSILCFSAEGTHTQLPYRFLLVWGDTEVVVVVAKCFAGSFSSFYLRLFLSYHRFVPTALSLSSF
jgi:hypothetical protein